MNKKLINIFKNVKAQMTIFIILGFVILIVFMMLSATTQGVRKAKLQSEAKQTLQSFIETSTIQQYITSCVDIVLDEGIEKIALQGGNLYDYQGGLIDTSEYSEGTNFINVNMSSLAIEDNPYNETNLTVNVSYGLKISKNNGSLPYLPGSISNPPFYPSAYRTLEELNGFNNYLGSLYVPMLEGFYGETIMPKFCEDYVDCKYDSGIFDNFNTTTLQKQLENYLEVQIKNCVNFSYFEELTPYTIKQGNVTASVKFSVEEVSAVIDYPVTMSWRGQQPITEIITFSKNKYLRLSKIYRLAHSILKYESFDIFFDPLNYRSLYGASSFFNCKMSDRSRCYDSQITVTKISNICEDCEDNGLYDDLIVIKDNSSQIKGKSLIYQFVVQNRRPALDYIHNTLVSDIDIFVAENETINLRPEGYDPDGTLVWYNYSGWRENYYTIFNRVAWYANQGLPFENYIDYYGPEYNEPFYDDAPLNWSQSNEFKSTEKNASYTPKFGELGLHNVTITIWDEEGLRDWQNIKIMVLATPTAIANGSNNFSDIDNKFASAEDSYILNASNSYVVGGTVGILQYIWNEISEQNEFGPIYTENPIQILPDELYTILDVHTLTFSKEFLDPNSKTREVNISLIVSDGYHNGQPDYLNLIVHECLPHVKVGDDTPYPYSDDMYQATHVCCGSEENPAAESTSFGEIEDAYTPCFDITEYSSLFYFFNNQTDWYEGYLPSNPTKLVVSDLLDSFDPTDPDSNDIYRRDFTRNCDGTRGNICNGSATSFVTSTGVCDDETYFESDYRCSGPDEDYFTSATTDTISGCVVYGNDANFEFLADEAIDDPACRQAACYGIDVYDGGYATEVYPIYSSDFPIKCTNAYCNDGQNPPIDGNCNVVYDYQCSCSDDCGGNEDCNTLDPGELIEDVISNGCKLDCQPSNCVAYAFNSDSYDCYTNCENQEDSKCNQDDNYRCDDIGTNDACVQCNFNTHIQLTGPNNPDNCELACGADTTCDEVAPSSFVLLRQWCDSYCHFIDCRPYAFNQGTHICYDSCYNDNQCAENYECQNYECELGGTGS